MKYLFLISIIGWLNHVSANEVSSFRFKEMKVCLDLSKLDFGKSDPVALNSNVSKLLSNFWAFKKQLDLYANEAFEDGNYLAFCDIEERISRSASYCLEVIDSKINATETRSLGENMEVGSPLAKLLYQLKKGQILEMAIGVRPYCKKLLKVL